MPYQHTRYVGVPADAPQGGAPVLMPNLSAEELGAVTQITSIVTGVTVNTNHGQITTFAASAAAAGEHDFVVTNNQVRVGDVVLVSIGTYGGGGTPVVHVVAVANGSFTIRITNLHATVALDALMVINFVVMHRPN